MEKCGLVNVTGVFPLGTVGDWGRLGCPLGVLIFVVGVNAWVITPTIVASCGTIFSTVRPGIEREKTFASTIGGVYTLTTWGVPPFLVETKIGTSDSFLSITRYVIWKGLLGGLLEVIELSP